MDRHSERFRNHISIVAEQLGRGLWFVGAVAVGGVVQNVREAVQLAQLGREAGGAVLQGLLVALVFLVILVAWQILVWARTFISIDGTTLVIERNTLNRKVNTIGIGNISNVNTEQNLFEMLVGTCKIKLPNMPGGMPSLRRSCLAAQTMPESSQFIVSSILFLCYTVCENNSTLQSTAW